MRHFILILSKFFLILLFAACSNQLSEVSIYSNLQTGDSISVALYSQIEDRYVTINGTTITSADAILGRVDISLQDSLIPNTSSLSITVHCYSDSILAISSIRLKGYRTFYPQDIMHTLWWQHGLMFEIDSISNNIKSPINNNIPGTFPLGIYVFYKQPRPIGLQLFLRISFLATLLILIFIFTKQAPTQRLLLFTIALFLASLPLKIDYTNYTMGLMSLTMIVIFIWNKFRHFTWQPVFYALCAIYLLHIVGLLYTGNLQRGFNRLDSNITLVLFPVVFSMIQFPKKNVLLLLRFFVWSVIAFCLFGLFSYATIVPEFTLDMAFRDSKLYAPLLLMWPAHWHPSFDSTILLMAVPVALYLRFQDGKQITLVEMLLGVLLPIIFTILVGARIGIVITPVLLGLGYLFYCKFRPVIKWGLIVAGIATTGLLVYQFPKADDRLDDPIREDLRAIAINAIKEKPVFGWGTGYVYPLIQSEGRAHQVGLESPLDLNQFHNQYLEDTVQFGIPGILVLLAILGWMLWSGIREKDYLLLSLLAIYVLFFWTETALATSKGVVPFTFWLCFLVTTQKVRLNKTST